ncbi:hypothetical protein [Acidovorax sp. 106]|uniref:hypothetical protein n=1 Tax=Acidovorax sp. 106 TaxID=2135637 RepID=UPI000EB3C33B|nr:hypothetical protein [Acidovorax sp. 106]
MGVLSFDDGGDHRERLDARFAVRRNPNRSNRDNAVHALSIKSFAQVSQDEINGVLELAAPIAADVPHDMASGQEGS